MNSGQNNDRWALILGASSGFGAAAARALADAGYNIFGVHLDLKATLPRAHQVQADVEAKGRTAIFFNRNVADDRSRAEIVAAMREHLTRAGGGTIQVLLHSLAFGNLKRFIADDPKDAVDRKAMEMTLDVMANSLVYWTQDLVCARLLTRGAKVFALTSAGSHRVFIGYGPVSAAKAALESHTRQLALELIAQGICVIALQPGAAYTPALRMIPNHEKAVEYVRSLHPDGRLTQPEDVARVIVALADPRVDWVTGTVLRVDGGEDNW